MPEEPRVLMDRKGTHRRLVPVDRLAPSVTPIEGLLYADIDTHACVEPKQFHDVVGHYTRFDVFHLTVDRTRQGPASLRPGGPPPGPGQDAGPSIALGGVGPTPSSP